MAARADQGLDLAWLGRAAVVALLGWWFLRLGLGSARWCALDWVNLPFHEAGHVFLTPFGRTVHFLGGTIFQLAIPAVLVWYALVRRGAPFAAAFCLFWLGESVANVATYMADARELQLDLVGGGEHDWNELFFRFGVLDEASVRSISGATRATGVLIMLLGLAWALLFLLPTAVREGLAERLPHGARLLPADTP